MGEYLYKRRKNSDGSFQKKRKVAYINDEEVETNGEKEI